MLLAIIGPNRLNAEDEEGNRWLDSQNDYVRIEIAAALQRDIPVIPILLDGVRMPNGNRLPDDLKELEQRSTLEIRHTYFDSDVDRLIQELKRPSKQAEAGVAPQPRPKEREQSIQAERNSTRQTIIQEICDAEVGLIAAARPLRAGPRARFWPLGACG